MKKCSEIAKRMEEAFPEFGIGVVGQIIVGDAKDPSKNKLGWKIIMAELQEVKEQEK